MLLINDKQRKLLEEYSTDIYLEDLINTCNITGIEVQLRVETDRIKPKEYLDLVTKGINNEGLMTKEEFYRHNNQIIALLTDEPDDYNSIYALDDLIQNLIFDDHITDVEIPERLKRAVQRQTENCVDIDIELLEKEISDLRGEFI